MPLYEHVFITRQDASAQQVEDLTAQYKTVIEQMGGKVAKTEQWGVKSLSYFFFQAEDGIRDNER